MSDVLKALGLEGDAEEHPARTDILGPLGLAPEQDEHPASKPRMLGSRVLEDWETTPGGKPPPEKPKSGDERLREMQRKYDPLVAGREEAWEATKRTAAAGSELMGQGVEDASKGRYVVGPAKVAGGALLSAISPIAGATEGFVTNPLARLTGNPEFAEKAGLFVPMGGASKAAKPLVQAVQPSSSATRMVAKMVGEENIPEVIARLRENPRLRLLDVSDPLRVGAQGLVDPAQPKAMTSVLASAKKSMAEAKDAVRSVFDSGLGSAPNIVEAYETLQKAAQTVGRQKINPALKASKPVDVTSVVDEIDSVMKPGVQAVASPGTAITPTRLQQELVDWRNRMTDGKSLLTDANRLHDVQSELRRYAKELMDSQGPDKRIGRQLMAFRDKLVDSIDAAAPGYKKALADYKDAMDVQEAFKSGLNTLQNQAGVKGIETRPEYLERWMKTASEEEIAARKLGARDAIEQKMGAFQYAARRGTDIPEVDFNRRKMEILFGKEQTDKMFKALKDERDIALSNQRITSNSKTAETLAAQSLLKPRDVNPPNSNLPSWALAAGAGMGALTSSPTMGALAGGSLLGARAGKAGVQWLGRQHDLARNRAFANIVSATGPERDAALAELMASMKRSGSGNKLNNLIVPP